MISIQVSLSKAVNWWDSLTTEQKEVYVEQHPNSKHSKEYIEHKKKLEAEKPKSTTTKVFVSGKLSRKWTQLNNEQKEFFGSKAHSPNSVERKQLGKMINGKASEIVDESKEILDDWEISGKALKKFINQKRLTNMDKSVIDDSVQGLVKIIGRKALMNADLSRALSKNTKRMGSSILKDIKNTLTSSESVNLHRKAESEEVLEYFVKLIGNSMSKGNLSESDWLNAAEGS